MADSGQQQPADAEVDTLVNDIFEMLTEMNARKIDISCERQYFNKLLQDMRVKLQRAVSARRMQDGTPGGFSAPLLRRWAFRAESVHAY